MNRGGAATLRAPMPPYLRPMGPTAPNAILCGDPARALAIAQHLLTEPRMSNHHRGLWSYFGSTERGAELSVQATGIGGPSAALVLDLMAARGLRNAIRVGSCRAGGAEPPLGSRVAVEWVHAGDGAATAYGAEPGELLRPDAELTATLRERCEASAGLASLDRLPDEDEIGSGAVPDEAAMVDLQSAALLAAARARGVRLAIGVVVGRGPAGPLPDEPLEAAALQLAADAAAALEAVSRPEDLAPPASPP